MSIAPSEVVAGPRVLSQGLRVQHRVSHFSHSRFSELGKVGLFNRGLASTGNAYPSPKSSPRGPMGASQISRFSHSLDFRIGKSGFFGGDAVLRRGRLLDPGSQVLSRGGATGARRISRFSHYLDFREWEKWVFGRARGPSPGTTPGPGFPCPLPVGGRGRVEFPDFPTFAESGRWTAPFS